MREEFETGKQSVWATLTQLLYLEAMSLRAECLMVFSFPIPQVFLEPTRAGAVVQSLDRKPGFCDASLKAVALRKCSGQRSGHEQVLNQPQDPHVANGAPSHASFTQVPSENLQQLLSHCVYPAPVAFLDLSVIGQPWNWLSRTGQRGLLPD